MGMSDWQLQNRSAIPVTIGSYNSDTSEAESDSEYDHGSPRSTTWLNKAEAKPAKSSQDEPPRIAKSSSNIKWYESGGVENSNPSSDGESTVKRHSTRPRSAWRLSSSFWTRMALVMILALSVMATALAVLRLYHATVYEEARELAKDLQQEVAKMVEVMVSALVDDMAPGVLALAGNLHRQGLVDAIARDPHDELARRMLWETFDTRPLAEGASFGTDKGASIFARTSPTLDPVLIEAEPQDLASPFGDWKARYIPIDPALGEPLSNGPFPEAPFLTYNVLDHHVAARRQPPRTVYWWTGPIRVATGEFLMHYIAACALLSNVSVYGSGMNESSAPVDNGTSVTIVPPRVIGAVGMAYTTRSLTDPFQGLELRGGRLFLSQTVGGVLLVANHGRLFTPAEGGADPQTITAEQSDDPIIAAAARHLRQTFAVANATGSPFNVSGSEQAYASHAAAAGLCWESYDTTISIDGQQWYLKCQGKVYGSARTRLSMVGVLLIPRDAIMGRVDRSQHRSLAIMIGVTVAIAVLGVAFVCASTAHVGRMAKRKEQLEGQVQQQEGEIQSMAKELDEMRALLPGGLNRLLDMRTPMETVHDLLAELAGASAGPGSQALATIQRLLRMPELHMPIVLQQRMGRTALDLQSPGQVVGEDTQVLDDDTTAWLRSTVMRLPTMNSSMQTFSRRSSGNASGHSSTTSVSPLRPSHLSDDAFLNTVRDMVGFPASDAHLRQEPELAWGGEEDEEGGTGTGLPGAVGSSASKYALQALQSASDMALNLSAEVRGPLRAVLERVGEWNFNSWELLEVSMGRPILWMGLEVFRRMSLMREFRLPRAKLARFLAALDEGMLSNGYHNSTHIADVTNSLFHLLKRSGVGVYLTRLDTLAVVTAALVHDFRHPGLNNDFVVKSADTLALRYNDLTVLENYHVAEAFLLMVEADLNIFEGLDEDDFKYLRRMVIEIVLASDLKRHFEMVEAFKAWTKDKESPLSKNAEGHRLLLMQIALKVADIGHAAKKLDIHKRWTAAITEEFYLQGDKERAAGFKVSPFMDRKDNNLAKSQLGFFSFIALPLFQAWVAVFPDSQPIMEEMAANVKYWESLQDGVLRVK
eukprot:jgi/Mesvir1/3669/Mv14961-RA.1